jgi:hypothetical protein
MIFMQKSWEIIKMKQQQTLIYQQCIKSCINEKITPFTNSYLSTVLNKWNFLKVSLCKPKMNNIYTKLHRKDVILC